MCTADAGVNGRLPEFMDASAVYCSIFAFMASFHGQQASVNIALLKFI